MAKLTKKEYLRLYHLQKKKDPEYIAQRKAYYQEHKEYFKQKSRECYLRTKEKVKARWQAKRKKVLAHYGNKCNCCGESMIEFLAIDHVNNDGHKHRRGLKSSIFDWAIKNKYPKTLQILCHNCNLAKAFYGKCPHND